MDNELSQLDALIESDVLDALGKNNESTSSTDTEFEDILIEDLDDDLGIIEEESIVEEPIEEEPKELETNSDTQINETASLEESIQLEPEISSNSLAKLLSELLNNKTIEITIKIKD